MRGQALMLVLVSLVVSLFLLFLTTSSRAGNQPGDFHYQIWILLSVLSIARSQQPARQSVSLSVSQRRRGTVQNDLLFLVECCSLPSFLASIAFTAPRQEMFIEKGGERPFYECAYTYACRYVGGQGCFCLFCSSLLSSPFPLSCFRMISPCLVEFSFLSPTNVDLCLSYVIIVACALV